MSDYVFIVKSKYSRRHVTLKYDELCLGVTEIIPYQYVKLQTMYFNLYTFQEGKEKNLFGTEINYKALNQGCTNFGRLDAVSTKSCKVSPNTCVSSV